MFAVDSIPLEMLTAGQWAEVLTVMGKAEWVGRMAELGVRAGAKVQMLHPGSPCLLLIGGSRLSLRGDAGLNVLVRPALEQCQPESKEDHIS